MIWQGTRVLEEIPEEFFMPRCVATLDENIPLLGGASDSGRVAPQTLGWVRRCWESPPPSAFAIAVAAAATPPTEGIFQRSYHERKERCIWTAFCPSRS